MNDQSVSIRIPIRAGEILDQAFRLYRRHFVEFVLAVAIFQVPAQLISLGSSLFSEFYLVRNTANYDPNTGQLFLPGAGEFFFVSILFGLLLLVLNWYGTSFITRLAGQAYFSNIADLGLAFRGIGRRWLTLMIAVLAVVIVAGFALTITIIPCIGWLFGPGLAIFLLLMVLPLMSPVVVFEGQSINASFRRAVYLIRQKFWWVFGYVLALGALQFIVGSVPVTLLNLGLTNLIQSVVSSGRDLIILSQVAAVVTSLLSGVIVTPLTVSAGVVLYLSLRAQVEGLDLVLANAAQEVHRDKMVEVLAQDVPRPVGGNNRQLFANYVLLSLIGFGLYLLLAFVLQISLANIL